MKPWLRLLLITLTVGGGFTGFSATLPQLSEPQSHASAYYAMVTAFLALYGCVVVSGILLVHKPQRTFPMLFALAVQIPWVSSPLITYRFSAGFHLTVGIVGGTIAGGTHVGSDWQFGLLQPSPWGLGVNLVALLALIAVIRCSRYTNSGSS